MFVVNDMGEATLLILLNTIIGRVRPPFFTLPPKV